MKKKYQLSKSDKTQNRINKLNDEINEHRRNIRLLKKHMFKPEKSKGTYAPRITRYAAIPKCANRFAWTIRNLTHQINELEKELSILIEYGV